MESEAGILKIEQLACNFFIHGILNLHENPNEVSILISIV